MEASAGTPASASASASASEPARLHITPETPKEVNERKLYMNRIIPCFVFLIGGIAGAIIFGVLVFACPVLAATLPLIVAYFFIVNFVSSCATILVSSLLLVKNMCCHS
jgi:uncharacterized membrane protein